MRTTKGWIAGFAMLMAATMLVACTKERMAEPAGSADSAELVGLPAAHLEKLRAKAPQGTSLAYEHTVDVKLAAKDIPARIEDVQSACFQQSIGDCAVLDVTQEAGDHPRGSITVRVAPKGVDLLIQRGATGGEIVARNTRAEDLAEAVADNALRRSRLEKEHARLLEFQDRPNVKLEDLLSLSKRLAEIEASLDAAKQEHAQQRRRIDTHRLTLRFSPTGVEEGGSEIGNAFRDSGHIVALTTAGVIRVLAAAIPLLLLAWVVWTVVRALRRRRERLLPKPGSTAAD